jgi:hypothetical protein
MNVIRTKSMPRIVNQRGNRVGSRVDFLHGGSWENADGGRGIGLCRGISVRSVFPERHSSRQTAWGRCLSRQEHDSLFSDRHFDCFKRRALDRVVPDWQDTAVVA